MKAKVLIILIGLIALSSWPMLLHNNIEKAQWLLGTWDNKTSRGTIYETWTKLSAKELHGKSYTLKEHDTILIESIKLVQEPEELYYIPTVINQNENLPVRFVLKSISDLEMIFENPEHDFPQIISYKQINSDSLIAEISGLKNGQERKQTFPMRRVK